MRKLAYYISLPFLYGISLLPFPVFYRLSDLLYLLLYKVAGYRKQVVMENLRNAFPEKTPGELKVIASTYYRNLSDIMLETIKMLTLSRRQLLKRFRLNNPELPEHYYAQGRSVIGIVGHYGNWEWACLIQGLSKQPSLVIYKPLNNPYFNRLFCRMRARTGAVMVPMKRIMRKLVEYRNRPSMTIFAADQTPVKSESVYWTRFLNQDTPVFLGAEKIARMNDSVVLFCDINRLGRGRYEVNYKLLFENPRETQEYEITEAHLSYLEKRIRESPADWLWSHRRWKHSKNNV